MFKMFRDYKFNPKKSFNKMFVKTKHILTIAKEGHSIGLHSHNHPIRMSKLKYNQQFQEYNTNLKVLCEILKKPRHYFSSMSHPCGSYNNNTLKVLEELGIEIGFRHIMQKKKNYSSLEIPRQDHAEIYQRLNQ